MRYRGIRILFFVLTVTTSCASRQANRLNDVESWIEDRPDSALALLARMDSASLNTPELKAHYALLRAIALDKNYVDTADLRVIRPATEYYSKHGTARQKMLSFYYEGRILYNGRRDAEAIHSQMRALEHARKTQPGRYLGLIYASMADLASRSYCWEETALYVQRAKEAFLSVDDSLSFFLTVEKELTNLSNQGRKGEVLGRIDSLMNRGIIPERLLNDFLLMKAGMMVDTAQVDYHPALAVYIRALQNGARPTAKQKARYAYALAHCGYSQQADQIFVAIAKTGNAGSAIANTKQQELLADQGRYEEAYHMLRESLDYQDEKVSELLTQSLFRSQREFFKAKEEEANLRNKNQRSAIFILILSLVVSAMVMGFLISHFRRKAADRELEMERLAESVGTIIDEKERSYSTLQEQFRKIHQEPLRLLEKYYKDFEMARRTGAGEKELYGKLLAVIKDIEGDSNGQHFLDTLIDEQHEGIMKRLYSECPGLNKQDYLLFSYTAAGFERSTIGMLLGNLSADAIHARRSRLRKALKRMNPPSLQDFIALMDLR